MKVKAPFRLRRTNAGLKLSAHWIMWWPLPKPETRTRDLGYLTYRNGSVGPAGKRSHSHAPALAHWKRGSR